MRIGKKRALQMDFTADVRAQIRGDQTEYGQKVELGHSVHGVTGKLGGKDPCRMKIGQSGQPLDEGNYSTYNADRLDDRSRKNLGRSLNGHNKERYIGVATAFKASNHQ